MNLKITGRFILTEALVTIMVIIINFSIGIFYGLNRSRGDKDLLTGPMDFSPEDFTENFGENLILKDDKISLKTIGKNDLDEKGAWLQQLLKIVI